jgi:hypothetical protein
MASRDLSAKGCGVSDIVERLRNWRSVHLARLHLLMDEAADEIEGLRGQLSGSANQVETRQPTLTDEERAALYRVADDAAYRGAGYTEGVVRGLLKRLK